MCVCACAWGGKLKHINACAAQWAMANEWEMKMETEYAARPCNADERNIDSYYTNHRPKCCTSLTFANSNYAT